MMKSMIFTRYCPEIKMQTCSGQITKLPISNSKLDVYYINEHTKLDENPLVFNVSTGNGKTDGLTTDGRMDGRPGQPNTRTSSVKP